MFANQGEKIMYGRQEFGLLKRRMKDGKYIYYYWIYDESSKRVYRSTGKRTKAEAMKYVMTKRDNNQLGEIDKANMSMASFCKDLYVWDKCPIVQYKLERGRAYTKASNANRRHHVTKHIIPLLGSIPVSKITAATIDQWTLDLHSKHNLKRSTSNGVFGTLKEVLDYAVKCNLLPSNPCDKVDKLGDDSTRHASFTKEEVKAILGEESDWPNPFYRLMCELASMTGMRIGEMKALKADQIGETSILVNASYSQYDGRKCTKNRKSRPVPIPPEMRTKLMKLAPVNGGLIFSVDTVRPLKDDDINQALKDRCTAIGIPERTFHSFRAYFNSELESNNVNETVIRAIMGHQSARMSEHYLHLETSQLKLVEQIQNGIMNG